jgi:hypothetical protein
MSNPDHVNLKLYRLLLEEDLIKLTYKGLKSILESSKLIFKSHYIVGNWVPLMHVYIYDSKFIEKVES